MLNVTVGTWLESVHGDNRFYLNIRRDKEQIFLGYENEVPDEVKSLIIDTVYLDSPDNAFGIKVR